jgi:hypothetical protein
MYNKIDWSQWILKKNQQAREEELKKSDSIALENLEKSAKNNALHRLFRDLAPHVNGAHLTNVQENQNGDLEHSSQPHSDGLVGFDVRHDPNKKDVVDRILENHGHFRHSKAFAEDIGDNNQGHSYGIIQLNPDRAKNLVENAPVAAKEIKPGSVSPVREPAVGSMNLYEGSRTGEGNAISAKWRGSDPRHVDENNDPTRYTRAGMRTTQSSGGQFESGAPAATSGVSDLGYTRTETGKPVRLAKK